MFTNFLIFFRTVINTLYTKDDIWQLGENILIQQTVRYQLD